MSHTSRWEQVMLEPKQGFCLPTAMPLYGSPPFECPDSKALAISFRTSPEAARQLVPEPLVPNPQATAVFSFSQISIPGLAPMSYAEAALRVPCALDGRPGSYFVVLYLDRCAPLALGREIYGLPKKEGYIILALDGPEARAELSRNGHLLAEARLAVGDPLPPPEPAQELLYNLKLIPSVVEGAPPDVMQITACRQEVRVQERRGGESALTFGSGPEDPLGDIPVLEVLGGTLALADVTVGWGEVAYDYLAKG